MLSFRPYRSGLAGRIRCLEAVILGSMAVQLGRPRSEYATAGMDGAPWFVLPINSLNHGRLVSGFRVQV